MSQGRASKSSKIKQGFEKWKEKVPEGSKQGLSTPLDIEGFDYLNDLGFPGSYPFTRGSWPTIPGGGGPSGLGRYSGYGTPEDTRDKYKQNIALGIKGASVAFDLPTQLGYDSDNPQARGEVGRVGVAIDTLRDLEVVFEAFDGVMTLDKLRTSFTANAQAAIILAMYIALAEKRGIHSKQLMGTIQNDILKEIIARGTHIFPVRPSMKLIKDTIEFCVKEVPRLNIISICGYHIREAGSTAVQELAFMFSNAIAYVELGLELGLEVDQFAERFSFLAGGGMDFFEEIAKARAARKVWATIMKDRFKAVNPRTWRFRGPIGTCRYPLTAQKPINNIARGVLMGLASLLGNSPLWPGRVAPYDEALGLGHSAEADEISRDATGIIFHEAKVGEVVDPLAGSYYVEALTKQIEDEVWKYIDKIDAMGGAVGAIEKGYMQGEIAQNAYSWQKAVERGDEVVVGVNKFLESESSAPSLFAELKAKGMKVSLEVEQKQIENLSKVKKDRSERGVNQALKELNGACKDEKNLMPYFINASKAYCTIGEMCDVLRENYGEYIADSIF
jgi:methylmalonyl-CoA mutase N-terminal domain/subunit